MGRVIIGVGYELESFFLLNCNDCIDGIYSSIVCIVEKINEL